MWRRSVLPVNQETQLGRLITTVIDSFVWAGIDFWGQICGSPVIRTGTWRPCGPVTETLSIVPPPSGIVTLASAVESALSVALEDLSVSAATAAPAISTITAAIRKYHQRTRRGRASSVR